MKRREFIIQTGTVISASMLSPSTILAGSKSEQILAGVKNYITHTAESQKTY
jgi:hypothetical protein